MFIRSLHIGSFGHFEDRTIDGLGPGLVVLYGPNEAGKSTLRQAIRWLLFGAQRGDKTRWQSPSGELNAALVVGGVDSAGHELTVSRTRTTVETLTGTRKSAGEGALRAILGGTDLGMFDGIFSFDSFELQQIAALKAERLQALLAVGAIAGRGRNPADLIAALDKEAQLLWKARVGGEIRDNATKLKDAKGRLSDAQRDARAYAPLVEVADALTERLRGLARTLDFNAGEVRRARQIYEAWPHYTTRQALLDQGVREVEAGDPDAEAAAATLLNDFKRVRADRVTAEGALVEAEAQVAAVVVDEAIVREGPAVKAVASEVAQQRERAAQLDALREERGQTEGAWTRARRLIPAHIDDETLAGLPTGPASVAEARTHATVTAALLRDAGPQLREAEAAMARLDEDWEKTLESLAGAAPSAFEVHLGGARAYLAGAANHLELTTRRSDCEAKLRALESEAPARPELDGPELTAEALGALETWREDWTLAAASRDAALAAARAAYDEAVADRREAEVECEEVAAAADPAPVPESVLVRLEASGDRARELVARLDAHRRREAELRREEAEAAKALGLVVDSPTLAAIDHTAPARHRVRRAFEAVDSAARRVEGCLQRREAAAGRGSLVTTASGRTANDAAKTREDLLRARSAIDVYHQARSRDPGAQAGRGATAWLNLLILLVVTIVAVVMTAYIVSAVAVAGAVALWVVGQRTQRGGAGHDAGSHDAEREVARAFKASALHDKATRADVEIALARAEDDLAELKRLEAERVSFEAVEAELAAARHASVAAVLATDEALAGCGLPRGADLSLAEAYFTAAAAAGEARGGLARVAREKAETDAHWLQLKTELAGAVAAAPEPFHLEAVLVAIAARRARTAADRELAATAAARLASATRALGQAEAALKRAEAAPAVEPSLEAGWRAWATVHGLTTKAPTVALVLGLRAVAGWASHKRMVDAERRLLESYNSQLKPYEDELQGLLTGLNLSRAPSLRASIELVREAVATESARAMSRENLEGRRAELELRRDATRQRVSAAKTRADEAEAAAVAFGAFAGAVLAPEAIGPREIEAWVEQLITAQRAQREDAEVSARVTLISNEQQVFMSRVRSLAGRLGEAREALDVMDAEAFVTAWRERLDSATADLTRLAERQEQVRAKAAVVTAITETERAMRLALDAALAAAGCADEAAWDAQVAAREVEAQARREIAVLEAELRGNLGPTWQARMEAAMAELPEREAWAARQSVFAEAITDLERDRLEAERELAETKVSLRALETSLAVVELAAEVEALEGQIADGQTRYYRNRLARRLLADTFERFRRTRQPAVIKQASGWLAEATSGAYTALDTEDDSQMTFVVVARDGRRHSADALSTGTTGLVYLCLRLALALDQGREGQALPIVADDILAHFDAERAEGAARLLSRVATEEGVQILVFTCQRETVATITDVNPGARVVELPRWAGRDLPAPRHGTKAALSADLFDNAQSKRP